MHVDFDIADRVVWAQRVLARLLARMHHMGIKLKRKEQRNMLALLWTLVAELWFPFLCRFQAIFDFTTRTHTHAQNAVQNRNHFCFSVLFRFLIIPKSIRSFFSVARSRLVSSIQAVLVWQQFDNNGAAKRWEKGCERERVPPSL